MIDRVTKIVDALHFAPHTFADGVIRCGYCGREDYAPEIDGHYVTCPWRIAITEARALHADLIRTENA